MIPTRDRWPLLRIALGCALAQCDVDLCVVVVDDGSADATPLELRTVSDSRVQVLRHDHPKGVSAARNLGLAQVTAPWVAFLDDDDVWAPGHLAAMVDAAQRSGADPDRVGLVYSGCLELDADWRVTQLLPAPRTAAVRSDMNRFNPIGCPSRVVLRTEALRRVGGFDEHLAIVADWDLWVRIGAEHEIVRSPELLVGYKLHDRNMHLDGDRYLHELALIQHKHGWSPPPARTSARVRRPLAGDIAPQFIASAYRARGRRFRSARWYLRSFRLQGRWRDLGRALGVLLGERMTDLSRLRQRKPADPAVGRWLEDVRQNVGTTTQGLPPTHGISGDRLRAH